MRRSIDGTFSVTAGRMRPGDRYRYLLDDDGPFPDPWSRWQPEGVHGPSAVLPSRTGRVTHLAVRRASAQASYELHVGTFTEAGTYRAAARRFPELRRLGVDTVQVMPLAEFPGQRNWGYDGAYLYAPARTYGDPPALSRMVGAAHRLGLSIILDAVFNHLGPDGAYIHRFAPQFFDRSRRTPWGGAIDYSLPHVRRMVADCARWWIEQYGFDGFRLDAVNSIVDSAPRHVLAEIRASARRGFRNAYFVVEDSRNHAPVLTRDRMDAVLSEDFSLCLRTRLAGERRTYLGDFAGSLDEVATAICNGWIRGAASTAGLRADRFVFFIENHDQVGHRTDGRRLAALLPPAQYRVLSTLLLLVPERVMVFMGQEFAAASRFHFFTDHEPALGKRVFVGRRRELGRDVPDPQQLATYAASKLPPLAPGNRCFRLYRDLFQLRNHDRVLRKPDRDATRSWSEGNVLYLERRRGSETRLLALTFEGDSAAVPNGRVIFHTERRRYGGAGRLELARPAAVLVAG